MSIQIIPFYVLQAPNWIQPDVRVITVQATRDGIATPDYKVCRIYGNVDKNEMAVDMPLRDGTEVSMSFLAEAVDGPRALMLFDSQPDRYGALRFVNINSDLDILFNLEGVPRDVRGQGILSGSFPLSMITQGGNLPSHAEIRILYRPESGDTGDGIVVSTTTCNADGSWQVSGLDEKLKFDIVARIPGFNDVIISDVHPTGAPLSAHFANLKEEYEYKEIVSIQVVALGGRPPYTFTAIELPNGLSIDPNTGIISGIVNTGPNLDFQIKVNDSADEITISGESYVDGDPHWDNVVALLHFDGDFTDQTGKVWQPTGVPSTTPVNPVFGSGSVEKRGGAGRLVTGHSDDFIFPDDFTIEAWILTDAGAMHTMLIGYINNVNELLPLYLDSASSGRVFWKGSNSITGLVLPVGEWFHYALTRESGVLRAFVNGVLKGSTTRTGTVGVAGGVQLLGDQAAYPGWRGQLDEFRITKGVARYTENFTPPTGPFPNL